MCGIFGYIGDENSYDIVRSGLERLAYRGYDSAGIVSVVNSEFLIEKCVGHPELLAEEAESFGLSFGHNRWATHGVPSIVNSHPHFSNDKKIALVHNGIIENYAELKSFLEKEGFKFASDTDSEIVPNLIQFYSANLDIKDAIIAALRSIRGAYAMVFTHLDHKDRLFVARLGSPACIAKDSDDNIFISSDFGSLPSGADNVVTMADNRLAIIARGGAVKMHALDGAGVDAKFEKVELVESQYHLGDYAHFLEKEIFEQPDYLRTAITGRVCDDEIRIGGIDSVVNNLLEAEEIIFTGCGSAFYAAQIGAMAMETIARIRTRAIPAGELKYYNAVVTGGTVLVSVSQSGETADTIGCIKAFKNHGALNVGIVNVPNSTISKMVDAGIYIRAGKEVSVASTKAVMNQITAMLAMAAMIGAKRDFARLSYESLLSEFKSLPGAMLGALESADKLKVLAKKYAKYNNMLTIGRGPLEVVAKEAALKIKEISYIHAEGYSAAELKHGPLALISEEMPTLALVSADASEEKMISNIREIKARKGTVIGIFEDKCSDELRNIVDDYIEIPTCSNKVLNPLMFLVPCQLFSYYLAIERGCSVDMPRNLAKSVSVE